MALLNVVEAQRNSAQAMLHFQVPGSADVTGQGITWKILVYDKAGQEVLTTLMKVASLRQNGVTLHIFLHSERTPIPEAPAVYFVEPTEENIDRIIKDLEIRENSDGLYHSFHFNFLCPIPDHLLERLARGAVRTDSVSCVSSVIDRCMRFVSLSPTEFHLAIPNAYSLLYSTGASESMIEGCLSRIVDGLYSVVVTLDITPFVVCPSDRSSPAQLVGRRLTAKLANYFLLNRPHSSWSQPVKRPVLILFDRQFDLAVVVGHSWTYQALLHDIFGISLNRVTVPVKQPKADAAAPPTPKIYDLDGSDQFWSVNRSSPFTEAAVAISDELVEFNKRVQELGQCPSSKSSDDVNVSSVQSAINALPEMSEKKRLLDMHTNIATAMVAEIKSRQLDKFFEMEDNFHTSISVTTAIQSLQALLGKSKGTAYDRLRAALYLCLVKDFSFSTEHLSQIRCLIELSGAPTAAFDRLRMDHAQRKMHMQWTEPSPGGADPMAPVTSQLARDAAAWGTKVLQSGRVMLMQGVKQLLPLNRELPIETAVERLLAQETAHENFLILDPKGDAAKRFESQKQTKPFKQAIVFVVGGGSFSEAAALRRLPSGGHVVYGATDFIEPSKFLAELMV